MATPLGTYIEQSKTTRRAIRQRLFCGLGYEVTEATIGAIANGKRRPSVRLAQAIEAVTGIPKADLLYPLDWEARQEGPAQPGTQDA